MTTTETRSNAGSSTARTGEIGRRRGGNGLRTTAMAAGAAVLVGGGAVLGHYVWKQPERTYAGGGALLSSCSEYTVKKAMENGDSLPLSVGTLVVPGNAGDDVRGQMEARMIDGSLLLSGDKADAQEFAHDSERIIAPGSSLELHQGHQTLSLTVAAGGEVTAQKTC